MIGWGWIMLAGSWVGNGGTLGAIIAFLLGGVMAIFVGLTYAESDAWHFRWQVVSWYSHTELWDIMHHGSQAG